MSLIAPLLPLKKIVTEDDDDEHHHAKLEQRHMDDSKTTLVVPHCEGDDMEKLLLTVRKHHEAARVLHFVTGEENFDNF